MPGVLLDRTRNGLLRFAYDANLISFATAAAATVAETLRKHCGGRYRMPAGINRTLRRGRVAGIAPYPAGAGMFRRHYANAMALQRAGQRSRLALR